MATAAGKTHCVICQKERTTSKCSGCLQDFCFNHLGEHRQELIHQFDEIEHDRNVFLENLNKYITNPQTHVLMEQINQWEKDSVNKIQQTAEQARQFIETHIHEHMKKIEIKLTNLTDELKDIRKEDDFNEIILNKLKEKLNELQKTCNQPSNIVINQDSSSFINKISVVIRASQQPNIKMNSQWVQNGITVAGTNKSGNELNQLQGPFAVYVDDDRTLYVADKENHRIVEWRNGTTNGRVVAGGNGEGEQSDQLNGPINVTLDKESDSLIIADRGNKRVIRWPRRNGTRGEIIISNVDCFGLAMDNNGHIYVSDYKQHEVRRYKIGETNGILVAGGNGKGDHLNQLNFPVFIAVDQDYSVYVSDGENDRVMKWLKDAKEGIVVSGGQGQGNNLTQLSMPGGIVVDQLGTIYVVDYSNHRVMRWLKGAKEGEVIVGGNGKGKNANQFDRPGALSFDQENDLYIVDHGNHRIQKFKIKESSL